ncbi:MAG: nucleotidyltransferase domain-containing protein [Microthrixaceae bacterium]
MAEKTGLRPDPSNAATARLIEELDRARRDRGESKAEVARGAGLGEPAVRRLLSGRRANPTVRTLEAVAEHLGLRLALEREPRALTVPKLAELRAKVDVIERIVEAHGGRHVRVFGSVARGDARPGSDVDLLVDVEPGTGLLELGAMEDELSEVLGLRVDVVTSGHGRMRHIHDDAVPLR